MDSLANLIVTETIKKENKNFDRWKAELRASRPPKQKPPPPAPYQSAQLNYLDQTLGLARNPHDMALKASERNSTPNSMLTWGVSREGQGRTSYLKLQSRTGGPHERYGRQVTSNQEIGWTAKKIDSYSPSPFARRPLVKNQFYRPMGVSLSTGSVM
mmetsp:Transcript_113201/g.320406  ORF Transcript_113201/g.320406 Transcript_113201/m.320406 type:complete len:157 (+) Transcript_113201:91-561(+)